MGISANVHAWYGVYKADSLERLVDDLIDNEDEWCPTLTVQGSEQVLSFVYYCDEAYPYEPSGFGVVLFSRDYNWEPWTLEEMSQECEKELATCKDEVDRFLLEHGIEEQSNIYVHTSMWT